MWSAGFTNPNQQSRNRELGVSTPCGAVSTCGINVLVPGLLEVQRYGRISDPGMRPYPPRVRRDLDVGPGETLAARWLHEPQSINNQPRRLGFPHRAGRYRPGGPLFSSPVRRSCRGAEGFLIKEWGLIVPAWRWLYEPQSISDQPMGLGFHTVRGGINPENHRFRPRLVGVVKV